LEITNAEMQRRLASWRAPAPRYTSGVMAKYALLVSSSALGAITVVPQILPSTMQPGTNARTL
jgi:dihydroxyacid dehydratase/phosphogluconate dehydratase